MAGSSGLDLLLAVKDLRRAKSRLLGAADGGGGSRRAHAELVLAMVSDTLTAALATQVVRHVVVVTPDPAVAALARRGGAEVLHEEPEGGLNSCLESAAGLLRRRDPHSVIGALQADLPALRPAELTAAVVSAAGRRSCCPDRQGHGTTLLLSAVGGELHPRFGRGSCRAHRQTGALVLTGPWPSLACDVDSHADLVVAAELGLGRCTASLLSRQAAPAAVAG